MMTIVPNIIKFTHSLRVLGCMREIAFGADSEQELLKSEAPVTLLNLITRQNS